MQYRQLGSSGIRVSVVGMGTMSWPGSHPGQTGYVTSPEDLSRVEEMVRAALDSGINFLDTAASYGRGLAEDLLGQTLEKTGRRDEVVVVTKVGPLFGEEMVNGRSCDLSAPRLMSQCEASLKRLRTDRIDVYLAHRPDETTPMEETMQAVEKLREQGKIRSFGVSNHGKPQLAEALKFGAITANQLPYSLVDRGIDAENRPFCLAEKVGIMAYSPLGKGVLSGKYKAGHLPPAEDYRHQRKHFAAENLSRHLQIAARLRELAVQLSCTPSQLALAWVLAQPGLTVVLPGAKSAEQVRDNAIAGDMVIPPEVLAELDQISVAV